MNTKAKPDWEEVTVRIQRHGKRRTLSRKIVSDEPILRFPVFQLDDILMNMRDCPIEIRLTTSDGQDAIRLFPCLTSDLKSSIIVAQTMGEFRRGITSKRIRFTHRGEAISRKEVERMSRRAKEEPPHVTPDAMTTCPTCGTIFRVGKKLV